MSPRPDEPPARRPRVAGQRRRPSRPAGEPAPGSAEDAALPPAGAAPVERTGTEPTVEHPPGEDDWTHEELGGTASEAVVEEGEPGAAGDAPRRRRLGRLRLRLSRRRGPRGVGSWVVAGLVVIVLALGASVGVFWTRNAHAEAVASARKQSLDVAELVAKDLFSVDYRHLDSWGSKAAPYLSSSFKNNDYQQTRKVVTGLAKDHKGVLKASVTAGGVHDVSPDHATALLYVDIASTIAERKTTRIDKNRLRVSLVKHGDRWLVEHLVAV